MLHLEAGGADAVARSVDGRPLGGIERDPGTAVLIAAAPGAPEPELGLGRFHTESLNPGRAADRKKYSNSTPVSDTLTGEQVFV